MISAPPNGPPPDPERIAELFAGALEVPPSERARYLDRMCGGPDGLRAEIESLLAAHDAAGAGTGGFLDRLDREGGAALIRQQEADEARDESGRQIGPWLLLHELGRGGMGVVHLARRTEGGFEQRAAVKLIKRGMDSDAIQGRFLRERRILAGLDHPNVARLLDGGVTGDGQPWFAMEPVEGEPLLAYCETRHLDVPQRLELFVQACRAVQYAHGRLVIHRDLKPSNMLVTGDGRLKLLDFGVARLLADGEDDAGLTRTGLHPLTPEYAAPEQVRGEPVTTATDVHALGLVLYEVLTGRHPYAGVERTREALARAACEKEAAAPSSAVADRPRLARLLRGDLDAVVMKALRKEPQRRYVSAEALAEDVRRFLSGQPVEARPDSLGYRAGKFIGRHRTAVVAATAAVLALVAGLAGMAWQASMAAAERDRARLEAQRAEQVKEFLVGMFRASDPSESRGREVTARELLERGAERVEKELSGQPAVQSELLHTIAVSFWALGRQEPARAASRRSLELARQVYGPEHPMVARGLDAVGAILYDAGEAAAAEEVLRQALEMRRRLLPPDSPVVAESMADLGTALLRLGKADEAEPLLRDALRIREKRLGAVHADTARSILKLAEALSLRGDHAAAIELERRALAVRRRLWGDRHPEVARSLSGLGNALVRQGDLDGAEAALREALGTYRTLLGEEHPTVAINMNYLAVALHTKGDLRGAEAIYRESVALERKLRGESHPNAARAIANLAHVLSDRGRFEEATPLFDQAIALHERISGPDDVYLGNALEQKAGALISQGRAREALPLLDRSLRVYWARQAADHPRVVSALAKMAEARAALGELEAAEKIFRETLDVQRRARPEPGRTTLVLLAGLGGVLGRRARAAESEPFLREALDMSVQVLPAGHWRRADIESAVGEGLLSIGRREEGLALARTGYEGLRAALGESHPVTARARHRLAGAGGTGRRDAP